MEAYWHVMWAGTAVYARRTVLGVAIAINLLLLCPTMLLQLLQQVEGRASYQEAEAQPKILLDYLQARGESKGVVLLPTAQYYLYKPLISNLYNPAYLVPQEDPKDVVAVVNCNTVTHYFGPGQNPLPSFVAGQNFQRIAVGEHQLHITLLHHTLMSRNWTWACDLYARP